MKHFVSINKISTFPLLLTSKHCQKSSLIFASIHQHSNYTPFIRILCVYYTFPIQMKSHKPTIGQTRIITKSSKINYRKKLEKRLNTKCSPGQHWETYFVNTVISLLYVLFIRLFIIVFYQLKHHPFSNTKEIVTSNT